MKSLNEMNIALIIEQVNRMADVVNEKNIAANAVANGEINTKEYLTALGAYDVAKQELLRLVKKL